MSEITDEFDSDTCPGCGAHLPYWREYPYHLPHGEQYEEPGYPPPYLSRAVISEDIVACEWDRRSLMNRYDRRHGVAP